ncbi:thioredoxin family protein [Aurantimonas manganoxydans]|nr:thioredoxin family protein [Aurantimonas manganoxydans]
MFEQAGCRFCAAFDAEIAPGYPGSNAGRLAPLRRVDIHDDRRGGIDTLMPAVFTPTFVLVDDEGREIGRLEGYPGRKWFYPEIDALIDRLPAGKPVPETAPD